eukprot:1161854-Pelagomonas_calceolata.AAC.10
MGTLSGTSKQTFPKPRSAAASMTAGRLGLGNTGVLQATFQGIYVTTPCHLSVSSLSWYSGCLGDGLSAQRGACTVKRRGAHVTCGTCAQEFDPESTGQVTLEAFLTCCARAGVSMPPGA